MGRISKRIFGDDINPDIKLVLAARQALAKTSNPGESIEVKSVIIDGITQTINPKEYSKLSKILIL